MLNRKIVVLFALAFLATLGYGIMIPTLSVHAHALGASHSEIGAIVSAFAAAQLLTQIPMGRVADWIGRVYMVVFGFALMAVAATLYHFAASAGTFMLLQAIAGLGAACLWPPLMAMLAEDTDPAARGRVMGAFNTVFFLGISMGPLAGGFINSALGHEAVFTAWTVVALLGALLCVLTLKESAKDKRAATASAARFAAANVPLIKPGMRVTFAAGCIVRARGGVCSSFNNALLPLYAIALFDATPAMIGSIMFIHGLGLAVFNIPGGMMSDRMGRRLPALAGSLVATAGVLWYSAASGYWALFVAVGIAGAGAAFSTPAVAALTADICDPTRRGEAFGYFLTSFNLGMVLGALVFGFVAEWLSLWGAVLAWGFTSFALSLFGFLIRETLPSSTVVVAPQLRP